MPTKKLATKPQKAANPKKLVLDKHFNLTEKEARKFNLLKKQMDYKSDIDLFRHFLKNF